MSCTGDARKQLLRQPRTRAPQRKARRAPTKLLAKGASRGPPSRCTVLPLHVTFATASAARGWLGGLTPPMDRVDSREAPFAVPPG